MPKNVPLLHYGCHANLLPEASGLMGSGLSSPKHPQANGYLERFNRTIQEQFVNWYIDELDEPNVFNRKLMEYLIWYNIEKPHRGIGNLPPLRYYLDNFFNTPEKSNMFWTLTSA